MTKETITDATGATYEVELYGRPINPVEGLWVNGMLVSPAYSIITAHATDEPDTHMHVDRITNPDGKPATYEQGLRDAMEIVGKMRQSEAGLFDAAHSGQRGEDRSTALYDAYHAIRKAIPGEQ